MWAIWQVVLLKVVVEEIVVDKNQNKAVYGKTTKILIVFSIVAVLTGMYFWKNASESAIASVKTTTKANVGAKNYPLKIKAVNLGTIKSYGVPTVIDFGSDSCVPCKEMAPVLTTLNSEWQGKAAVQFMDVWKYQDGVKDFPVQDIPTQVFFNADGTPFAPSEELRKQINLTLYYLNETNEHVFTVHQGGITEAQMRQIFAEMGIK